MGNINIFVQNSKPIWILVILSAYFRGSTSNQCTFKDGQCTYNVNLSPTGSCPQPEVGISHQAPEGIRQRDDTEIHQMEQDFKSIKSDHENRIKELENSIQKVLRNAITSVPVEYTLRTGELDGSIGKVSESPKRTGVISKDPNESSLLAQLQRQFNSLRTSLSTKTTDLIETKNQLNETAGILKENQRELFKVSGQVISLESKVGILERDNRILKNRLKDKTERLKYATEQLNVTEGKLASVETQLYDVIRSESTLKEELGYCKIKWNETKGLLDSLQANHTALHKRHQRVKTTLHLREQELMECYTAKTQTFCGFEDSNLCGFTQINGTDMFNWTRGQGRTPSANTGPDFDHTCRHNNGHYMYIESSGKSKGHNALLYSPKYRGLHPQCVQFYYHMAGRHVGTLTVHTKLLASDELQSVWRVHGNQGNLWILARLSIPEAIAKAGYQIIFEGTTDVGYEGDISIDDVGIKDGECDSHFKAVEVLPNPADIASTTLRQQVERYRKLQRRRQRERHRHTPLGNAG